MKEERCADVKGKEGNKSRILKLVFLSVKMLIQMVLQMRAIGGGVA